MGITAADGLRGVGLYETSNFAGLSVSMAGGGFLNIAAQDAIFDTTAQANTLSFRTSSVTESELTLNLPLMSGKSQIL